MKFLFFFLISFGSSAAIHAADGHELFVEWLQILETPLQKAKTGDQAVANLLAVADSRIAAFNLQALGRTFSTINSDFTQIRFEFKKIEDGLGKIDKWKKIKNSKNEKLAMAEFAKLLTSEKWFGKNNKVKTLRTKVHALTSGVTNFESQVTAHLATSLQEIDQTVFDFSGLESFNGLHEFRREVRWFMIEARMTKGLISFKDDLDQCPNPGIFPILADGVETSKYSQLPAAQSDQKTCQISACLFYGLSDTVEKFGKVKDDVEKEIGNTNSDITPPKYKEKADLIYSTIRETNIFALLADELNECSIKLEE